MGNRRYTPMVADLSLTRLPSPSEKGLGDEAPRHLLPDFRYGVVDPRIDFGG